MSTVPLPSLGSPHEKRSMWIPEVSETATESESSQHYSFISEGHEPRGGTGSKKAKVIRDKSSQRSWLCTYRSLKTGKLCHLWDTVWAAKSTRDRHAENEHGDEEIELIEQGKLCYDTAQVIVSIVIHNRVKNAIRECDRCKTVLCSRRPDSLNRHQRSGAW